MLHIEQCVSHKAVCTWREAYLGLRKPEEALTAVLPTLAPIMGTSMILPSGDPTLAVIGSLNPVVPIEGWPGLAKVKGKPIGVLAILHRH